jgi:hypothetical protein
MGLQYRRRYVVLLTVLAACWIRLVILACQDPPPIYGFYAEGPPQLGSHMHCHIPPDYDEEHDLCLLDASTAEELEGSRYVAWASGRTLQDYRGLAVVAVPEYVDDMDWVQYWNHQLGRYDDPYNCYDGSRWMGDASFWNSVQKTPDWHPPSDGTLIYIVQWFDDDYLSPGCYASGSRDPEMPYDYATIPVVNNTYAGWSYIIAADRYLSRHGINDSFPPPVEVSLFDQGKAHIAVGGNVWVTERRHIISYEVNRYTANSTICPLEAYEECAYWYFGPPGTDDPNYIPGHVFQPTTAAGVYPFSFNHTGVGPMLTPPGNAVLSGQLLVCDASFLHPAPPAPGQSAMVGYALAPNGIVLDVQGTPPPVRLTIWDPSNATFARFWESSSVSDTFSWDGWMYANGGTNPAVSARLGCSDYFMRVEWRVRDHSSNGQTEYYCHSMSKEEDRLIFDVHAQDTDPALRITQIAAGGVDNPVHTDILGVYTNPPKSFTATASITSGGLGIEPTVYNFLGQPHKLGEKVDARMVLGGQVYVAGSPNPIVVSAWGSVTGTLRSSNHAQTVAISISLNGGLGGCVEAIVFAVPSITLLMPERLFPETPDTTSVTLQIGGGLPRRVPGHELLFNVDGLTFKSGPHLDWTTDAYLRDKPLRLDRFVQVRTAHYDPEYGTNITELTNEDGFASATITIVEPLIGIENVEVKVLDGSVEK